MSQNNKKLILYFANWLLKKKKANHGGEVAGLPWHIFEQISHKHSGTDIYLNHAFWAIKPDSEENISSFERREKHMPPRTEFSICSMSPDYDLNDASPSEIIPDLPKKHFAQYEYFLSRHQNVKVLISIGGWARCGY